MEMSARARAFFPLPRFTMNKCRNTLKYQFTLKVVPSLLLIRPVNVKNRW